MGIKIKRKEALSAIGYELTCWGVSGQQLRKLSKAIYYRLQYDGAHRDNPSTPKGWEKRESAHD